MVTQREVEDHVRHRLAAFPEWLQERNGPQNGNRLIGVRLELPRLEVFLAASPPLIVPAEVLRDDVAIFEDER